MRLRRVATVAAIAFGAIVGAAAIGTGTGLAAAPETLAPTGPTAPVQVVPVKRPPPTFVPAQLRPEIIAHRGDHAGAVENTPDAIASAMANGADAVEFDVVATADNIPVILHDGNLETHTVNCRGMASAVTYREIRTCRKTDGKRVPNLDEMLREIPAGKHAYVHLKTPPGRGIAHRLMAAVDSYGQNTDGRVTFFSSYPAVLEELRAAGALSLGLIFNAQNETAGWAADYPVLIPYRVAVSPAEVRAAHARGQLVIAVQGVPMTAARALALGVDGFMADDLAKALKRLG